MADQMAPGDPQELKQDALVEKLVVNPSNIPDVKVLVGFVGKGSEGRWRLYLTPQLNDYLEFNAQDVLHTQPFATAQSPLGGTVVWINRNASLQHTQTAANQAQAGFVQGDIMSRFMTGPGIPENAGGGPAGGRGPSVPCISLTCFTFFKVCISLVFDC